MAAKGSTSARSAADLVLTEPDVSLLLDALVEGRADVATGSATAWRCCSAATPASCCSPCSEPHSAADADERRALLAAEPPSLGALLLGGRNPLVVATGLGSAAVLAGIIQVPGISQLFGCTPLGPLAWAVVLRCATAATVISAVLPRFAPGLLIDHRVPVP